MTAPRRALITGASTGIGREIAIAFSRDGYDIAITAPTLDGDLEEVAFEAARGGGRVVPIALDQREEASITNAVDTAVAQLGALDVLVNNAARALVRPIVETSWDDWNDVLATNLRGPYFLSRSFARQCIAQHRPGAIVCLSSTHARAAIAGRSAYGIAKAGIEQMTRMMAIEWAEAGIRVNAVAPTTVLTPSRTSALADPERRRQMLERIPMRRFPEACEIAAAVLYLSSPAAASITGHVLTVDGGLTAQ